MKVSLGLNLRSGPFGGGNQFGHALTNFLRERGIAVSFDLSDPDLDIILLTDPRQELMSCAYDERDILKYILTRNRRAVVVHRVNECDERKGTTGVNRRLMWANRVADQTVFVSQWLMQLFTEQDFRGRNATVIHNGSDSGIFNSSGYKRWDRKGPLKLVTHHWGGNWMKGFDIYQRLDRMLTKPEYRGRIHFTYIGNVPTDFSFENADFVSPKSGHELAAAIKESHVYLTASLNEPGGNHQNEGALCGLPLLYRNSGCMPEYCDGFGLSFTEENFEQKIREMTDSYEAWTDRVSSYPHTAEKACKDYFDLFCRLCDQRDEVVSGRPAGVFWKARTMLRLGVPG
jgi:hypothetical protein